MTALEMIHTYSLVHDDLPEMDNDELRRGKPTTHIKYGQAMAVLAGDGLLNFAFETALKAVDMEPSQEESLRILKAMKVLSGKAGIYGMIGGQVVDVESEKKNEQLSMEQVEVEEEPKKSEAKESSTFGRYLRHFGEKVLKRIMPDETGMV